MQSDLRYSCSLRTLHWLVVLAVSIAVAAIEVLDFFSEGSAGRATLPILHQAAGFSAFVPMVLRLLTRVTTQAPPPVPGTPLVRLVARLMHGASYALMVGMPFLGLLALVWGGKPIQPLGPDLPLTIVQGETLAHLTKGVHESDATLVYVAVGLHAAVALWCEFIPKNRLLRRMIWCT